MLVAKIKLKKAQDLKQFLIKNKFFNKEFLPQKKESFVYFPLIKLKEKEISKIKSLFKEAEILSSKRLKKVKKPPTLEHLLKGKLTPFEIKLIPRSQEKIGSILVLEIPWELEKKEKIIAQAFLEIDQKIKTVVKKTSPYEGLFRLRKLKILAGEKTKETIHQENKVKIKVDLEKVYFSSRLANERLRIAKQIKTPEEVLVMFSGCAPYPLVIAKNSPVKKVYGLEINPWAHQLALENLKLNKLTDKICLFEGDVQDLLPKIKKKFDRIVMPLPKGGDLFLDLALNKAKKGASLHYYLFCEESKIKEAAKKIEDLSQQHQHKIKILNKVVCGQYSPSVVRVCFDLKILK